jgi:peptidoglycan/LPS O-acetylase OafA/YrhL
VEVFVGLIRLRGWSRDLRLAIVLIVGATLLSYYLPAISKDTALKNISWFLLHPLWGLGFFILVNRLVLSEQGWLRRASVPSIVSMFAAVGVFSYSLYLTHELVIIQSWRWANPAWLQSVNVLLLTVPATLFFAWVFFRFCERPFMVRRKKETLDRQSHWTPIVESQPSTVSD